MKKIIFILICTLILVSCATEQTDNTKALITNIKGLENKTEVMLKDVTPFEWEIVYSFGPYTTKEEIQKRIGFKANVGETVNEGMRQLVFVKDEEVVCELLGNPSKLGIAINTFSNEIKADEKVMFKVKKETETVYLTRMIPLIEKTVDEIWKTIENREWSTLESGISGYGIYFYEENNIKYALAMIYGSGLPVIDIQKSEIKIVENMIFLDFPNLKVSDNNSFKKESVGVVLHYKDDVLYLGETKLEELFEYSSEYNHYDEYINK